jgi:hypothetical protein
MSGQLTCYNWATEQIGWDPEAATAQMELDHSQAMQQFLPAPRERRWSRSFREERSVSGTNEKAGLPLREALRTTRGY